MMGDSDQFIEIVKNYFFKKYTYKEICELCRKNHDINISVTTLRRILKQLNLKRKSIIESPKEVILAVIIKEVYDNAMNLGYKALHQRLRSKYRLSIKQSTVLDILRLVDPQGIDERSRYRLKRRSYKVPGPNYLWHIDGYDKLKKFGFAIHGCVDGFSRRVVWLNVATTNNNPQVIGYYYLQCILRLSLMPTIIRSDKGTENTLIDVLQMALRHNHTDENAGEKSFIKGKSTSNERIEKFWKQLRNHTVQFYISLFKIMQDKNILDVGDTLHIELLRFCFGHLIQQSLNNAMTEWNAHRIRRQRYLNVPCGIPNVMYYWPEKYESKDYCQPVNQGIIKVLHKHTEKPLLYNEKVKNFVRFLVPDVCTPRNTEDAYNLFITIIKLVNS